MQEGVCTSEVLGGECSNGMSSWQRAKRPTITAFAVLTLASVLPYQSTAQVSSVSSQAPTPQTQVPHSSSPEILAMHARLKRPKAAMPKYVDSAAAEDATPPDFNSAQGPGAGAIGPGQGCDLFPAPANIGTAVPLSYFGPPPSTTNESLVGPVQLLNTGQIDTTHGTITIPLYLGYMKGSNKKVWYILTDVDDPGVAAELGLNFSAKMAFMGPAARTANFDDQGNLIFDKGTVDFSPVRDIVPGPPGAEFPPVSAKPGEIGDANYGPYVEIVNAGGVIYNAPIVAFGVDASEINFPKGDVDYSKVHDEVVAIDPYNMVVTINLINGFSFGRSVWYISMDASIPLAAAIEHNTYAPLMQKLHLGDDDSFSSPIERIFIATNGPEEGGCDNPFRQGLSADLADGHRPNNTLGGIPTLALDYSPAWDANLYTWTQAAHKSELSKRPARRIQRSKPRAIRVRDRS